MRNVRPMKSLLDSKCLYQSAKEHAVDIGSAGEITHESETGDTLSDRIRRHAKWNFAIAENISVVESTGKDIVIAFIIDDGNSTRDQRKNIFNLE